MPVTVVGLLHPGEMGAALGATLRGRGLEVLWASSGRSAATARRADEAGLGDARTARDLAGASGVIVSVCPPHAAVEVARAVAGFDGVFVDANAVSPATARAIGTLVESGGARYVDGGIVGAPPTREATRLYLSGPAAGLVADLFRDTAVTARVLDDRPGTASALKMAYAAWTKGAAALLLAIRALARGEGVDQALLAEWEGSLPELAGESLAAARAATRKGWRWVGEMEEIASSFSAAGVPDGFHRAAAEVFRRSPRLDEGEPQELLERVLEALSPATAVGEGVGS